MRKRKGCWCEGWHLPWQRFRYWRMQIGFESAFYKLKHEAQSGNLGRFRVFEMRHPYAKTRA